MTRAAQGSDIARQGQGGTTIDFPRLVELKKGELAKVLPPGVPVDRVVRLALTAYNLDPKIRGCTPMSILLAVMKAAELNLEPAGGLKHGWLLPYKNTKNGIIECQFQIGYQGVLELARRSGLFRSIDSRIVLTTDEFSLEYDPRPILRHRPDVHEGGEPIGAYASCVLASGEPVVEYMSKRTIETIRNLSKQQHIWNQWWGEKGRNAVLKRMLKRQPLSTELRTALAYDDEFDPVNSAASTSARVAAPGAKALGQRLKQQLQLPPATEAPSEEDDQGDEEQGEVIDASYTMEGGEAN